MPKYTLGEAFFSKVKFKGFSFMSFFTREFYKIKPDQIYREFFYKRKKNKEKNEEKGDLGVLHSSLYPA